MKRDYQYYKKSFQGVQMPFAFLDRDVLDENIEELCKRSGNKKIRIATKSIRSTWVFDYLLEKKEQIQGLMCYTVQEAAWLAEKGFDDLLVAYPCFHEKDIESIIPHIKNGKTIYLMTDLDAHLEKIQQVAKKHDATIPVCLDMDMTTTFPGVYFGVYRSSVKDLASAKKYFTKLQECPNLRLGALMGYEAQIAGVGDNSPYQKMLNPIIRILKKKSIPKIAKRRKQIYDLALEMGFKPEVVNAGGTGSLESSREEECVTEVTIGSGFYASHLFDHYKIFKHSPAAVYAIEIVRQPKKDIYTCLGGGYV
ncbi:MAG: alanine racemase, partial [Saprospiraceae bacterium]